VLLGAGNVLGQEAPSFKGDGLPFIPVNCEITWAAPTNQLPKTVWIYKTIRQHFSDEAVSNLVALGSFTMHDRKELSELSAEERPQLSAEGWAIVRDPLVFQNEGEKRFLEISPRGYITYRDHRLDDIHSVIEDVPGEAMAQIGIPRSELATKPNSSELLTFKETGSRGHLDEEHKPVKEIDSRGVFFVRQIGGVRFAGIGVAGGFYIRFASHAKVAQLELVWRNLQPYKKYEVASPGQIMQWIKEGKAVVIMSDADKVNPRKVKKLTVTEISPLYLGEMGEELQDLTYPFASLSTLADTGQTNISLMLYCPILSDKMVAP
jgi:hypothetical protein